MNDPQVKDDEIPVARLAEDPEPTTRCYYCGDVMRCSKAVRVRATTGRGPAGTTWQMVDACKACAKEKSAFEWLLVKVVIGFGIFVVMAMAAAVVAAMVYAAVRDR